jgi:hypothetical protein
MLPRAVSIGRKTGVVRLQVGSDVNGVVVGQDQLDLDFTDFAKVGDRIVGPWKEVALDVVDQCDHIAAVGLQTTAPTYTTVDQRPDLRMLDTVDVDTFEEQHGAADTVGRGVVGQTDEKTLDVTGVQTAAQHTFQ